jgi:hypothetical protein
LWKADFVERKAIVFSATFRKKSKKSQPLSAAKYGSPSLAFRAMNFFTVRRTPGTTALQEG